MRLVLVCILSLFMVIPSQAQEADRHARASELNSQISKIMSHLDDNPDSATYYISVNEMLRLAMVCDRFDGQSDTQGEVEYDYRKHNCKRLTPFLARLIEGGNYFYEHHANHAALTCFATYMNAASSDLFQNYQVQVDAQVAYFAALLALGSGDYLTTERYASLAEKDANLTLDATEIKNECLRSTMETAADSARYLRSLVQLHQQVPGNQTYFRQIMDYYSWPGREQAAASFASHEIARDSAYLLAWIMLGDSQQRLGNTPHALQAYRKAQALSPSCIEARRKLERLEKK